jgi:hypothetical protein
MKIACVCLISATLFAQAQSKSDYEDAVTPQELTKIAQRLPAGPIYNIKFFHENKNSRLSAAVLSSQTKYGWEILLVSPSNERDYKVTWVSPRLADSFTVSDTRNLDTFGLADGEAISFSGCAPHMCPDIFSVLLYVPWSRRMYTATCQDGKTSYAPESGKYKSDLNELLHKMIGSESACSPLKKEDQ